ncbi:hypothetical protein [Streptomyces sp. NPDC059783]|uniref:hypothetical protein n=1 Tax=Streptomyces sp. NPDC059783 TaxID=3346944 RepID=UPI0036474660
MADLQPCPVTPRIDDGAADTRTLVDLGLADPPPTPQYVGLFVEPDIPPADGPE